MDKLIITRQNYKSNCEGEKPFYVCLRIDENGPTDLELCPTDQKLTETVGTIFVAKIKDIAPQMKAVFVEIAPGCTCYLEMKHFENAWFVKRARKEQLTQGDELVVQIKKEPIKTKYAIVSTKIELPGQYMVITNEQRPTGYSAKLSKEQKERLQKMDLSADKDCALIFRTNAATATADELLLEYHSLHETFRQLRQNYAYRTCYSVLHQSKPFYSRMLKSIPRTMLERVITDEPHIFREISEEYAADVFIQERLQLYDNDSYSLGQCFGISRLLDRTLNERVWMKSGAYLLIQQTEAMTVIDVNSGKKEAKKKHTEDYFLQVNLEAAEEIARQLRLRNISGICMVDFINLKSKEQQDILQKRLTELLRLDPVGAQFVDFTRLGIAEITRKKVRKSLRQQMEQ
ncbi:MAG: ribonuclease E/G [Lachnospiraceae bacterium]|nr:ribonuclease E/G [Lachnospiraceae bacterium]